MCGSCGVTRLTSMPPFSSIELELPHLPASTVISPRMATIMAILSSISSIVSFIVVIFIKCCYMRLSCRVNAKTAYLMSCEPPRPRAAREITSQADKKRISLYQSFSCKQKIAVVYIALISLHRVSIAYASLYQLKVSPYRVALIFVKHQVPIEALFLHVKR